MIFLSMIIAFIITSDLILECFKDQKFVGFAGCEGSDESRFGLLCKIGEITGDDDKPIQRRINPFYWLACSFS